MKSDGRLFEKLREAGICNIHINGGINMRKRSWARISRVVGIKTAIGMIIICFAWKMPIMTVAGYESNFTYFGTDLPLNDSTTIPDGMTSSFPSFGHYFGFHIYPVSDWLADHSAIFWNENIPIHARDNLERDRGFPSTTNNFKNRHPIHPVVTCQNAVCVYFNKEEGKNIIKYGKSRNRWQRYICQHCKKTLTETYGTFLQDRKLKGLDINQICALLVEKQSNRSIEKITGHHRDTIRRISVAIKENPEIAGKLLFYSMNITRAEMDELKKTINHN